MNVQLPDQLVQRFVAYASIAMALITSVVSTIHLPTVSSGALALFGILLHPDTSVTGTSAKPPSAGP
jgi:hypothetical protein